MEYVDTKAQIVLDCSIVMAWCFEDEKTELTEKIFDKFQVDELTAFVPAIWSFEVANVLLVAQKKRRISPTKAREFQEALSMLSINIDISSIKKTSGSTFELAKEENLTIYDAAYLELAIRNNLPLASLDNDLKKAANKLSVKLYKPL